MTHQIGLIVVLTGAIVAANIVAAIIYAARPRKCKHQPTNSTTHYAAGITAYECVHCGQIVWGEE